MTLIELLVVITIMMTMLSLVAPLAMNTVDKAEAQSEFLSFCSALRRMSVKAFSNGTGIRVELEGGRLSAFIMPSAHVIESPSSNRSDLLLEREYQYLKFPENSIVFNKNGVANLFVIELLQLNKKKELDLQALLEN